MDSTPNLQLPFIAAAQAQKHVTHNDALLKLDAAVQLGVASRALSSPPVEPAEGERYIAAVASIGAWEARDNQIAIWQDGAWAFLQPLPGWLAWVGNEALLVVWDGAAWIEASASDSINPAEFIGVNAIADAVNRLSVKSDSVLHSHDDVAPGTGDVRHVLNKATAVNTASLLFQTGYSGRAEFGLAGNDHWQVKVSADGASWKQAMTVDNSTGHVGIGITTPLAPLHIAGDDCGFTVENSQSPGKQWTIAAGRPGNYDEFLIISSGTDIGTPENHVLRFPKDSGPTFTKGVKVADGQPVASETSTSLAYYKPFTGTQGELSFRGVNNTGTAVFKINSFFHDGAWNGRPVALWKVDATGAMMGVNTHSPTTTLHVEGPTRVGNYTVASLPSAVVNGAGSIIYVTDEAGGAVPAFSDGTNWRRITDRAIVS